MSTSYNRLAVAIVATSAFLISCTSTTQPRLVSLDDLRVEGRVPEVKPAGVKIIRDEKEWEAGPPPYGYIRITGEPVVDWSPITPEGTFMTWSFLGPKPMSSEYWSGNTNAGGRVSDIAPHPTDANTCYIATASGGVWKTTNGGTLWTPITDELSSLNGGAIVVDPSNPNTVYLGTGGYVSGSNGDGIFRSLDAGATWNRIATTAQVGGKVSRVIVHPTNSNIIHATSDTGCFRSTDGGTTWTTRIAANCSALVINPTTPNTIYAGRRSSGVYRSLDGGGTYTLLTGGLPTSGFTYISLTICASNPQVLYAGFVNGGSLLGLYKTTDGGTTWTLKGATPNFPSPQGSYNCYAVVDPANANIVYAGGVDSRYAVAGITKTTDGGDTWAEILTGNVHPDHHIMVFGPGPTIWEGNDGGVYKSTNGGTTWSNLNSTLGAAQIYNIVVHPTLTDRMLGGTQDNGTPERTANSLTWPQLQAGDGGFSAFDSTNIARRYTTYVYLDIYRWNNSTDTNITGPWTSDPANFISPLVGDPNSATTLLGGTNRIWRSTNASTAPPTWTAISTNTVAAGGTINAIAVATGAPNTIYSGNTAGSVYVTTDAATWNNRSTGLPSGQISDIIIHPTLPGTAFVSYYNTSGNRVLKTTNFGVTWTNMTGTLPSGVAARALEIDWTTHIPAMYVGAGSGIYVSLNGGVTWIRDDASFPNVIVGDLKLHAPTRTIVAGTYGRGAWRASLPPNCPADFNGDGVQDFFDYLDFVDAFSANLIAADFNLDGTIDFFDYLDFVDAFSAGCI